ncbi:DUF4239 domain-containing protein [Micromonospora sp. WMMA1363]|uniref:bestrophin-like domain n=1 Tax=Micromonospora sp. WMMA1363 TaxID=3053985 RepID=UPI00259C8D7A|nr:DUF4239 domain-containing protein [Micromonospora sp. WMMA1363]MDM4718240.1 DUF4239 domain-containing protein [Micromonospora sp. WMMA1363]
MVPAWALFLIFLAFSTGIAVLGVRLLHERVKRGVGVEPTWLTLITHTIMVAGTFYALLLVLTAFSVYETYAQAGLSVATEAADMGALYRVVSEYPEPTRSQLQSLLREYSEYMVNEAWPAYQRGDSVKGDLEVENEISHIMLNFTPNSDKEQQLSNLALSELEKWSEARQIRYTYATAALPSTLWFALLFGAVVVILLSCLLPTQTRHAHLILVCAVAGMISLLLFVVESVDEPFRGPIVVSADPYKEVAKDFA